jgi:tetratricopeptide (TPR) repeat protein
LLILYLAFAGGGFDPIVYGRVGVGLWWLLLLAAAFGGAGLKPIPTAGLLAVGLLTAFATWTGLSMIWSESADRSAQELARASTYLGALVGALLLRSLIGMRLLLGAVAAAIGVIAAAAVLSRLQPSLIGDNETATLVGAAVARLNYPVNSWNGLAGLIAIGAPLLVFFGAHARQPAVRSLACAALPILALGLFLTLSRGGSIALATGLIAMLALHPVRRRLLPPLVAGLAGGGALIAATQSRQALSDGLSTPEALAQGDTVTLIAIAVCAAAALTPAIVGRLASRASLARAPRLGARARLTTVGVAIVAAVVLALAAGLPAEAEQRWEEFKDPGVLRSSERLESASGNGRYQWWGAALDANATAPLVGIGAGTFEFWWSREGSLASQVVDAHSLYLESLAELGLIGGLLIVGLVGGVLVLIAVRALGAGAPRGGALATAAGGGVAFAIAATSDWVWELPVVPISFLLIVGAALGARKPAAAPTPDPRRSRLALGGLSLLGALVILPPLLGADAIRSSQEDVNRGDVDNALSAANRAADVEPYSGPAELQRALVLELQGRERAEAATEGRTYSGPGQRDEALRRELRRELRPAAAAAREATRKEPTNWENWFTLSRIEVFRGRPQAAEASFLRARELNPSSALFDADLVDSSPYTASNPGASPRPRARR